MNIITGTCMQAASIQATSLVEEDMSHSFKIQNNVLNMGGLYIWLIYHVYLFVSYII